MNPHHHIFRWRAQVMEVVSPIEAKILPEDNQNGSAGMMHLGPYARGFLPVLITLLALSNAARQLSRCYLCIIRIIVVAPVFAKATRDGGSDNMNRVVHSPFRENAS
jgi:hypothetical protein